MARKTMQPMAFLAVMILSLLLLRGKTDVEADKSSGSIQPVAAADDDTYIEGDCIDIAPAAFAVLPDIETEPPYGLSYDHLIVDKADEIAGPAAASAEGVLNHQGEGDGVEQEAANEQRGY